MPLRRYQGTSQETEFPVCLPEAAEAAEGAEELVQLLEQQLSLGDNPITRLSRNLSLQSVISTTSSLHSSNNKPLLREVSQNSER